MFGVSYDQAHKIDNVKVIEYDDIDVLTKPSKDKTKATGTKGTQDQVTSRIKLN